MPRRTPQCTTGRRQEYPAWADTDCSDKEPDQAPGSLQKRNPAEAGFRNSPGGGRAAPGEELHRLDGVGLQALLALDDGERNLLAFLQALEALGLDRAEVHEHV